MLRKNKPADLDHFTGMSRYDDSGHQNAPHPAAQPGLVRPSVPETPEAGGIKRIVGRITGAVQTKLARGGQPAEMPAEEIAAQQAPVSLRATAAGFVCGFAVVSAAIFHPVLFLVLTLFLAAVVSALYVAYGYDGFWQMMLKPLRWYVARHPEKAAAIHAEIDRVAMRWDAILDRFPEGWVAALYLPDVSDIAAFAQQDSEKFELRICLLYTSPSPRD